MISQATVHMAVLPIGELPFEDATHGAAQSRSQCCSKNHLMSHDWTPSHTIACKYHEEKSPQI